MVLIESVVQATGVILVDSNRNNTTGSAAVVGQALSKVSYVISIIYRIFIKFNILSCSVGFTITSEISRSFCISFKKCYRIRQRN